jgi:RimJ/RimL family protein N-acetyltransferase
MQIRKARPEDASAIAGIYVRSWQLAFAGVIPQHYLDAMDPASGTPDWEARLRDAQWPAAGALLVEVEQKAVAFTGFGPVDGTRTVAEIGTFYALPEVWGTGVGKRLMATTVTTLEQAGYEQAALWVLAANTRARRLYEAAGWRADGTIVDDLTAGVSLPKLRYHRSLN